MQRMPIQNLSAEVPLPGTITIEPGDAVVIAFYGIVVAYSAELFFRCLILKIDPNSRLIRFFKGLMALSFFTKAILFMTFNTAILINCNSSIRTADLFYHIGVTSGVCVLLLRLKAVLPVSIQSPMSIFHIGIVFFRMAVGIIDVVLIDFEAPKESLCIYLESSVWGPVYTFFDTAIDLYVTIMIAFFLSRHIYRLHRTGTQGNIPSYVGIVMQNIIRTMILTVANLISAVFILKGIYPLLLQQTSAPGIMTIWPIVNMLYLLLIGYDADLAQAMRQLHFTVFNEELPGFSNPSPTVHPGRNGDQYAVTTIPCPYCGHRPSLDTSTPTFRREWPDSRHRPQSASRTPSFLATTTLTSVSSGNSEAITNRSPVNGSATGSVLEGSPRQTSSEYLTGIKYNDIYLTPSKTHSPSPSLNKQTRTNGESSRSSRPRSHCPSSAPSSPMHSVQKKQDSSSQNNSL